jgi:hypothetical protein
MNVKKYFKGLKSNQRKEVFKLISILKKNNLELIIFPKGFIGADISLTNFGDEKNYQMALRDLQKKGSLFYDRNPNSIIKKKVDETDIKLNHGRFYYYFNDNKVPVIFDIIQDIFERSQEEYLKNHEKLYETFKV